MAGDQPANAKEAERIGFGVMVPFQKISEKVFGDALHLVLNDPKYTKRAREFGALAVDQIQHPLERATWWLEHIMKHPHEYRNRSPINKLAWYQYFCIDVILTLVVCFMLIFYIIYKAIKLCCLSKNIKDKRE